MKYQQVSVEEVLNSPAFEEAVQEYSTYALGHLPKPNPDLDLYRRLGEAGVLFPITAVKDGELAGFSTVVLSPSAHYGKTLAHLETLFVRKQYRQGGTAMHLLEFSEQLAASKGAMAVTVHAPVGSHLGALLRRRYLSTHTVYMLPLQQ
jgi:GNAT superfamily N-acetyltransferase